MTDHLCWPSHLGWAWFLLGLAGLLGLWIYPAAAARRPEYGGTLGVAVTEPILSLDPVSALSFAEWQVLGLVGAGLFRLDADGRPALAALALPPTSYSGGRWRCVLRDDLRFHDGTSARAADVKASLEARSDQSRAWIPGFLSVEVIDDRRFDLLTARSLSRDELGTLLAGPGFAIRRSGGDVGAGLGPFRVARFSPEEGVVELAAYDQFVSGRPFLDRVVIRSLPDREAVIEAYHYGKADLVFEDSPRFGAAIRGTSPPRETIGLLVRSRSASRALSHRRAVNGALRRGRLAARLSQGAVAARAWLPHAGTPPWVQLPKTRGPLDFRWFIGTSEALEPLAQAVAVALGGAAQPWPVQPMDRWSFRTALERPGGRWDALLVSAFHPDPSPMAALRSLAARARVGDPADLGRTLAWIPLVDRRRGFVHRPGWLGIRWTRAGLVTLAGAWRLAR